MQKKILITGGSGFVGSHLCDRLIKEGHIVICMDNLITSDSSNIKHLLKNERFTFIKHDVIEPYDIECDEIYNLACPASPPQYQKNPMHTLQSSIWGMYNAIENAKRYNAKILQASTSEIYGSALINPQNEEYWGNVNPIGVRSCYDEGKRAAETMLMDANRQKVVEGRIVRIFNTYGPRMRMDDGRVVSNFICSALKDEDITIYGEGKQTRSFQYIDDLINGLLLVMENDKIGCTPINIGNPEEYTMIELALMIKDITHSNSKLVYMPLPQDDPIQRKPNIEKADKLLGWQPLINVNKGLEQTINYFKCKL